MATCSQENCSNQTLARGLCNLHYRRWQRHGSPTAGGDRRYPPHPCSIAGCPRRSVAFGLCSAHRRAQVAYGDPLIRKNLRLVPLETRLWSRIKRQGARDCWPWLGTLTRWGYGKIEINGKTRHVHRVVYELLVGPIPDGMDIDHLCHGPDCEPGPHCPHRSCENPAHMEPVTTGENVRRGFSLSSVNREKTHCPRGHPYSAENTRLNSRGQRVCRTCY
jgi:hypothetical protein